MKHEDKVRLALDAPARLAEQFAVATNDTLLKRSMAEAAKKLREMRQSRHSQHA